MIKAWFLDQSELRRDLGLRWWKELGLIGGFYVIYSWVRNQFGSGAVDPSAALSNAERVIDIEDGIGLYFESGLQEVFIDAVSFIQFWNLYYGLFHFLATGVALIWVFVRFPNSFAFWRTAGLATTGLAIAGFALFPLMPPRLLADCGVWGGCLGADALGGAVFIDTVRELGGLWSFDEGPAESLSNQYAAMPSLHFGWAAWCSLAILPRLKNRLARIVWALHPALTLFAIVVTANHYWIDALGGAIVLVIGLLIAKVTHGIPDDGVEVVNVGDDA